MLFSSLAKLLTDKYPVSICEVPLDCEVVDVVLYEETKPLPSVDCLCVFTAKQMSDAESLPLNIVCVGEIDLKAGGLHTVKVPAEFNASQEQAFIDIALGRYKEAPADINEGVRCQKILDALSKASDENRWIEIE